MITFFFHIKLLRPLNIITSGLAMFIASSILQGNTIDWNITVLTSFIVMCYTAAANALNDALDYQVDLINRPTRPIPTGHVKINTALMISLFLFLIGAFLCMQLSDTAKIPPPLSVESSPFPIILQLLILGELT